MYQEFQTFFWRKPLNVVKIPISYSLIYGCTLIDEAVTNLKIFAAVERVIELYENRWT